MNIAYDKNAIIVDNFVNYNSSNKIKLFGGDIFFGSNGGNTTRIGLNVYCANVWVYVDFSGTQRVFDAQYPGFNNYVYVDITSSGTVSITTRHAGVGGVENTRTSTSNINTTPRWMLVSAWTSSDVSIDGQLITLSGTPITTGNCTTIFIRDKTTEMFYLTLKIGNTTNSIVAAQADNWLKFIANEGKGCKISNTNFYANHIKHNFKFNSSWFPNKTTMVDGTTSTLTVGYETTLATTNNGNIGSYVSDRIGSKIQIKGSTPV